MKVALAADHAAYHLKERIKKKLESEGMEYIDFGTDSEESTDYADYAHPAARAVMSGKADIGVVSCGSGNGINMTMNKHSGIRSALCWNKELAALARQHNDANVLALPSRFISEDEAMEIVDAFLSHQFEGGRHKRRVDKITPG